MIRLVYVQPVYYVLAELLCCPLLWHTIGCCFKKSKAAFWQGFNRFLLIVSIIGMVYVTLLIREKGHYVQYPIPFHTFFRAAVSDKEALRGMLMNMLLFAPFGLFAVEGMPLDWSAKKKTRLLAEGAFFFSLLIELFQLLLHLGSFETDDLIFNTFGALIGAIWIFLFSDTFV